MSEGVKIHYKAVIDNILFLKRQQWTITNHALLLYAAITALATRGTAVERAVLVCLGVVGCVFSLLCLIHTQGSMTRYYQNLFDMHSKYFTSDERSTLELLPRKPSFNHNGMFIWGLLAANITAFGIAAYFIVAKGGLPMLEGQPQGAKNPSSAALFEHAATWLV